MDLNAVIHLLSGATFGLILRLLIRYKFGRRKQFYLNKSIIANVLASLFLGSFIALNLTNKNFILFFSVGFLGCLSTFSTFIYELFYLIQKRKYLEVLLYYIQVLGLSFVFFCSGYFIILIFRN